MRAPTEFMRLGDVCELFADGNWIETKDQSPSGIRLIQTGNIGNGEFKDRREKARFVSEATFKRLRCTEIFKGDSLVSRLPDPVGRSCLLPATGERMITAVDCTIIRFKRNLVEPKYFHYYAQSAGYFRQVESLTTGATRQRISRRNLGNIILPRPPLPEQQRTVALLDEAFAGLATATANAQKNFKNARELFESYLNSIFTQKGEGWATCPVRDFAEVFDGPHATPKTVDSGPIFLGISALKDGVVDLSETRHVTAGDFKKWTRRVKPQTDDVVFSYETRLGQAAIIPAGLECCLGRRMGLVRCDHAKIEPRFFLYQYLAAPFQKFLKSRTVMGATVDRISIKEFPMFEMWFAPMSEQQRVIQELDQLALGCSALETRYRRKLAGLADLKRSILQRAFSGELTSPPSSAIKEAAE